MSTIDLSNLPQTDLRRVWQPHRGGFGRRTPCTALRVRSCAWWFPRTPARSLRRPLTNQDNLACPFEQGGAADAGKAESPVATDTSARRDRWAERGHGHPAPVAGPRRAGRDAARGQVVCVRSAPADRRRLRVLAIPGDRSGRHHRTADVRRAVHHCLAGQPGVCRSRPGAGTRRGPRPVAARPGARGLASLSDVGTDVARLRSGCGHPHCQLANPQGAWDIGSAFRQ